MRLFGEQGEFHALLADIRHAKQALAPDAVEQAQFRAGLQAQYLREMPRFPAFNAKRRAPSFRGKIKKHVRNPAAVLRLPGEFCGLL